jgi:hypothetical protein
MKAHYVTESAKERHGAHVVHIVVGFHVAAAR